MFPSHDTRGEYNIRIHNKSIKRFKDKVRRITSRSYSISIENRIKRLNQTTVGWVNYFSIAKAKSIMQSLDEWIRRRLRMCIWKQWKKPKTKTKNLISLGIPRHKAYAYRDWETVISPEFGMYIMFK